VWINLEYLSAESWVDGVHGLPSPQPRLPLTRYFYVPGFTAESGGLLREHGLLARRDAERTQGPPPRILAEMIGAGALDARAFAHAGPRLVASLFCYDSGALPGLLGALARGGDEVVLLLPEGVAADGMKAWLDAPPPAPGASVRRGRLVIAGVPFLAQDDYDRMLWACDLNVVRGEDSFVRAQWAGTPFLWHIYPQAEGAHRVKLEAFLERYLAGAGPAEAAALRTFWRAWNDGDPAAAANAWPSFRAAFPALRSHGEAWARTLAAERDLATRLVKFCLDRL
jgi:uncharacterized repeat protein (TIGR03837 family)